MDEKTVAEYGDGCAVCGRMYAEGERIHKHRRRATGAAALAAMLMFVLTGCATMQKPRTQHEAIAEVRVVSVVSWMVPRFSFFDSVRVWNRVEERMTVAQADQFVGSFSEEEREFLHVTRRDIALREVRR